MKFAEPIWLIVGLVVCATLLFLYWSFDRRQRATLAGFASQHLLAQLTKSFSPHRRLLKRVLFMMGVALVFTALARPQWGFRWEETRRKGIDILFAVDTSKSMLAQDVKPDRMTRAKLAVTDLVNKLGGDRIGLIAFAGTAFLQSPLTLDYDAFLQTLDALDTNVIPVEGTDVASAIQAAEDTFGKEEKNVKILVLITDGEDLEAQGIEAAKTAAKDGLKIFTIGVGSAAGDLIPLPDANGGTEFLKDEDGKFVKSHLDESTLQKIAEASGGMYQPLGQRSEGLETVYQKALAPMPKQELASRMQKVFEERFQWPLGLGIVCLLAEMLIGTRRRKSPQGSEPKPPSSPRKKIIARPVAAAASLLAVTGVLRASPQEAEKAYKKGEYTEAEKQYEAAAQQDPETPENQFNLGAAAYKSGDLDKSISAFQKSLRSDKLDLQEKAYYNLGNTYYRQGQSQIGVNPDETINQWQSAKNSYESALKLKPDDADCKSNQQIVHKKLEALKKMLRKTQSKPGDGKNNKNDPQQGPPESNQDPNSSKDAQSMQPKPGDTKDTQVFKPDPNKQPDPKEPKFAENKKEDDAKKDGKAAVAKKDADKPDQPPDAAKLGAVQSKNESKQDQANASETQTIPGQMSRQEAQALLDSLKKDERALPMGLDSKMANQNKPHRKTW